MAGEVWKQSEVANAFLDERVLMIPDRVRQMELLLRLLRSARHPIQRVLDLGCGDGILLGTVLNHFPQAKGVGVDFSPPMLDQARIQLGVFDDRVELVEGDLSTPSWKDGVKGNFDAIISGYAIHHLSDLRKQGLYQEIWHCLEPGGLFLNTEHVASVTPRMEEIFNRTMSEQLWRHRHERGDPISQEELHQKYITRPDRSANILAPVFVQCQWLEEIGFEEVDCFWKYLELAIFGGAKPK